MYAQVLVEQVVQVVGGDNLDLGCAVIEQAVVERVLRDIEIALAPALAARRHARERGLVYADTLHMSCSKWSFLIPDALRPRSSLCSRQLQIYKDFMTLGTLRKMQQSAAAAAAAAAAAGAAATAADPRDAAGSERNWTYRSFAAQLLRRLGPSAADAAANGGK